MPIRRTRRSWRPSSIAPTVAPDANASWTSVRTTSTPSTAERSAGGATASGSNMVETADFAGASAAPASSPEPNWTVTLTSLAFPVRPRPRPASTSARMFYVAFNAAARRPFASGSR
jgi:hypothetical protein